MLSPLLFNLYLEHCLTKSEVLKQALLDGKLIAFADDILLICDNKQEASKLISGLEYIS